MGVGRGGEGEGGRGGGGGEGGRGGEEGGRGGEGGGLGRKEGREQHDNCDTRAIQSAELHFQKFRKLEDVKARLFFRSYCVGPQGPHDPYGP